MRVALLVGTLLAVAPVAAYEGPGLAGTIAEDTTWAGEVYVAGDLYLAPEATITVEPGTRVTVCREDALSRTFLKHGANYDVEIVVAGTFRARGTEEEPITFVPEPDGSPEEAWSGFVVRKGGALELENSWLVGSKWRLPKKPGPPPDVYHVTAVRRTEDTFWPARGYDGAGEYVYFYPDGKVIPRDVIKSRRGYSRWIIAPSAAFGSLVIVFFASLGDIDVNIKTSGFTYNLRWFIPIPVFVLAYLGGNAVDTHWGARRAQNDWLDDHPAFVPPF